MGLHYLHSKRIIHERLHLNNCLVDEHCALKLSGNELRSRPVLLVYLMMHTLSRLHVEVFNSKDSDEDNTTTTSTLSYYTLTSDDDNENDLVTDYYMYIH